MTRSGARSTRAGGQEHRKREIGRLYRPPVRDGLSRFELFHVRPEALAGYLAHQERPAAVAAARELAAAAGLEVCDVVRADYQDGGGWTVELVVVGGPA